MSEQHENAIAILKARLRALDDEYGYGDGYGRTFAVRIAEAEERLAALKADDAAREPLREELRAAIRALGGDSGEDG